MKPFEYSNATSLADAHGQLASGVMVKAGGIDLLDLMKDGIIAPKRLVNLRTIAGLDGISIEKDLALGPLVTLAQLAAHEQIRNRWGALAAACEHAATPQIRNVATIGGNLVQRPRCWYFRSADHHCKKKGGPVCFAQHGENQFHAIFANQTCAIVHPSSPSTALVAYRARVELTSPRGKRELPLEQFFALPDADPTRENVLAPDEIVTRVSVPAPEPGTRAGYHKQVEKESFDWPLVDVAVVVQLAGGICKDASIMLGGVAPVPWRSTAAQHALVGRRIDDAVAATAARVAVEGARPLEKNRYKLQLVRAVVKRVVLAAAGGAA